MSDARLYYCLRCHQQVVICRRCDRGHRFCGEACSSLARRESQQRAARRYRRSPRGKAANARRQQRFRERRRQSAFGAPIKKVTHQGSAARRRRDLLPSSRLLLVNRAIRYRHSSDLHCHFCGDRCDEFLRRHFLYTRCRV